MVEIPAGAFRMGDTDGLSRDALPVHEVATDGFLIDRCEVTVGRMREALQWAHAHGRIAVEPAGVFTAGAERRRLLDLSNPAAQIARSNGVFVVSPAAAGRPCVWVTWHGALAFCEWRTAMENERGAGLTPCVSAGTWTCDFAGTGYRLPTEAEWEKAARGGLEGHPFPWPGRGGEFVDHLSPLKAAYIADSGSAGSGLRPVGFYDRGSLSFGSRHPWGLCDMAGNAAEWCWDWYHADAYTWLPANAWPANPTGPAASPWEGRIIRGGSWFTIAQHLRCAHRSHMPPDAATQFVGFRTVRRSAAGREGGSVEPPAGEPPDLRALIEADWFEQDFPSARAGVRPDYRAAATSALRRAEATLELVRRDLPAAGRTPDRRFRALEAELRGVRGEWDASLRRPDWRRLWLGLRDLRRRILLSSPLLDFESLLFIRGRPSRRTSNLVDSYLGRWSSPGGGVVRLDGWRSRPRPAEPFRDSLPPGAVQNMDLSFDARRVAFTFCDHAAAGGPVAYRLHEGELQDGRVWAVGEGGGSSATAGPAGVQVEDFDPCYLPDGGIAFMSTRCASFSRCQVGRYAPSFVLYRADGGGRSVRRLCHLESNEWTPAVLEDGRILFTQWDYVNRHEALFHGLWAVRPDGTGVAHVYGNYTPNPCAVAQARPLPGSTRLVAIAAAHHSIPCGSLILVDPARGEDGEGPLTRLTPDVCFPETEGWPAGAYAFPWPLSGDLFLVSHAPDPVPLHWEQGRADAFGVYLFDTAGGRELIWREHGNSCLKPVPLRPRPAAPVTTGIADEAAGDEASVFIQNVYDSPIPIPAGAVRAVRVVRLYEQEPQLALPRGVNPIDFARGIAGTAPVQADGSAAFRVPARAPLLFQLLDGQGRALVGMRSQVCFQPGERRGCVGCHEPRASTTASAVAQAAGRPLPLRPPAGPRYDGGLSFARTVQPVLDRYCLGCHGLGRAEGGLNLLGSPAGMFSASYLGLTSRPDLCGMAMRRQESHHTTRAGEYGSLAAGLLSVLRERHRDRVRPDAESLSRIADWLDLNAPCYGDYGPARRERLRPSAAGEEELRRHVRAACAACHEGMDAQPLAALVNTASPDESRVLMAPLAASAGGWGQCRGAQWGGADTPVFRTFRRRVFDTLARPDETNTVDGAAGPGQRCD